MPGQAAGVVKSALTHRTDVRHVAGVHPPVHRQVSVDRKPLPAEIAHVGFLARVGAYVRL